VTLIDLPSPTTGLLFSHTLSVQSTSINFLEGCYHAYTSFTQSFPGLTLSTGTEDDFNSAFTFNSGLFHNDNTGLTHLTTNPLTQLSAYRNHHNDPVLFSDGLRMEWRNGDVSDGEGHKCTLESGGKVVGSPADSVVNAYTWAYVWSENERVGDEVVSS
jgi:hypothetical protein